MFTELRNALVLRAVFENFRAECPGVTDTEHDRIAFFSRYDNLPREVKAALALDLFIQSPLLTDTYEVRKWRRIERDRRIAETVAERLN